MSGQFDDQEIGVGGSPIITTQRRYATSALITNTSAFAALAPTAKGSPPRSGSTGFVWDTPGGNYCLAELFGTDANNENFDFQFIAWREVDVLGRGSLWYPRLLMQGTATLSNTSTTIDMGQGAGTNVFLVDTITLSADYTLNTAKKLPSTTVNEVAAQLMFDPLGARKIEFRVSTNGGSSRAVNGGAMIAGV